MEEWSITNSSVHCHWLPYLFSVSVVCIGVCVTCRPGYMHGCISVCVHVCAYVCGCVHYVYVHLCVLYNVLMSCIYLW